MKIADVTMLTACSVTGVDNKVKMLSRGIVVPGVSISLLTQRLMVRIPVMAMSLILKDETNNEANGSETIGKLKNETIAARQLKKGGSLPTAITAR